MTITIQLHCPSTNKTASGFVISPFQTTDQILQGIRLCLGIPFAALYTVDAKHVSDPHSFDDEQRVLVAAHAEEKMLPDAPGGYVLYAGEERAKLNLDGEGEGDEQAWEDLSDEEKALHITTLVQNEPTTRNILRITRPYQSVQDDLTALTKSNTTLLAAAAAEAEATLERCWATTTEHFLPTALRPSKMRTAGVLWDPQVGAALAVLSSLTHGQARLARDVLEEAVHMRVDEGLDEEKERHGVVRCEDVIVAVAIMYERAGVVPPKWTKPKSAKAKGRERRKALKEMKKAALLASGLTA